MSAAYSSCPDSDDLVALAVGEVREAVARHLDAGCRVCRDRLEQLRSVVDLLGEGPLPEVPEKWVDRAVSIFGRSDSDDPASAELPIYRSLPTMVPTEAAVPLRSARARHRVHRVGPFTVDIGLAESGALLGQVVPDVPSDMTPGFGTLFGSEGISEFQLDDLGVFREPSPPRALRSLALEIPTARLVIPDLQLDPPAR